LFIRITFFLLLSLNILTYFDQYFIHFPVNEAKYWGIGYRKLFQELSLPQYSNKIININHTEYSPYIFHLFYSKYDPLDFQKSVVRYPPTPDSFNHVKKYANYLFTPEGNMIDDYKSRFVYVNINQDQTRSDSSDIKVLLPDNKIFATIRNIE
jgi:hypothetical protein